MKRLLVSIKAFEILQYESLTAMTVDLVLRKFYFHDIVAM